jgi:hypothetical protein
MQDSGPSSPEWSISQPLRPHQAHCLPDFDEMLALFTTSTCPVYASSSWLLENDNDLRQICERIDNAVLPDSIYPVSLRTDPHRLLPIDEHVAFPTLHFYPCQLMCPRCQVSLNVHHRVTSVDVTAVMI